MYSITYRRRFSPLKQTIKDVLGHSYHAETDKMFIQTATGGREIMKWSNCEIHLGSDWKALVEQNEKDRIAKQAKAE